MQSIEHESEHSACVLNKREQNKRTQTAKTFILCKLSNIGHHFYGGFTLLLLLSSTLLNAHCRYTWYTHV